MTTVRLLTCFDACLTGYGLRRADQVLHCCSPDALRPDSGSGSRNDVEVPGPGNAAHPTATCPGSYVYSPQFSVSFLTPLRSTSYGLLIIPPLPGPLCHDPSTLPRPLSVLSPSVSYRRLPKSSPCRVPPRRVRPAVIGHTSPASTDAKTKAPSPSSSPAATKTMWSVRRLRSVFASFVGVRP